MSTALISSILVILAFLLLMLRQSAPKILTDSLEYFMPSPSLSFLFLVSLFPFVVFVPWLYLYPLLFSSPFTQVTYIPFNGYSVVKPFIIAFRFGVLVTIMIVIMRLGGGGGLLLDGHVQARLGAALFMSSGIV